MGVGIGDSEAHAHAKSEVIGVLLGGIVNPPVRDGGEGCPDMGVWKALGVVASNELLYGHVRS